MESQDLREPLSKGTLDEINRRLARLEQHLGLPALPAQDRQAEPSAQTGANAPARTDTPPPITTGDGTGTVVDRKPPVIATPVPSDSPPVVTRPVPTDKPKPAPANNGGGLETRIGTYWLNRIGIFILVVGLAYGVVQAYQFMGPAVKIAAGLAAGLALIVGGEFVGRREKYTWYGMGLTAGGYALSYFTTYAMHNIESVRILDSPIIGSILLLALAGVSMTHALWRRNETIALLSTLLAFTTLSLSPVTAFSLVATGVLVGLLGVVTVAKSWYRVFALATAGSYGVFLFLTQPQIVGAGFSADAAFFMSFGFLFLFWAVTQCVAFALKPEGNGKTRLVQGMLAFNAFAFVLPTLNAMAPAFTDWRWLFLAGTGAAYLAQSFLARNTTGRSVATFNLVAGLTLASAAVPLKFDAGAVAVIWFAELALLVLTALRTRSAALYLFTLPLTLVGLGHLMFFIMPGEAAFSVLGLEIQRRVLVGLFAAGSFIVAAGACRRYASGLLADWLSAMKVPFTLERAGFVLWSSAATATLWALPIAAAPASQVPVWWALLGTASLVLSIRLKETLSHYTSLAVFATAALATVANYQLLALWQIAFVTGLVAAASAIYTLEDAVERKLGRSLHQLYLVGAAALVWMHTYLNFANDPALMAVLVMVEAAAVLALGLWRRDAVNENLGVLGGGIGVFLTLSIIGQWTWGTILPVVAILYASYCAFRWAPAAVARDPQGLLDGWLGIGSAEGRAAVRTLTGLAGTVLLALAFGNLVSDKWLALAWSLEGVALVVVGFAFLDKSVRVSGLVLFALAVGRLLLIDFSGAGTTQRVLSFVLAGLALLVASYVYTWLGNRIKSVEGSPDSTPPALPQTDAAHDHDNDRAA